MTMRVRIVRVPLIPEIDGIRLDSFQIGRDYEVGNSIGAFLLAEGWAEPLAITAETPVVPFTENDPYDSRVLYRDRKSHSQSDTTPNPSLKPPDIAADMFRFKRRRRPKI